MAGLVIVILLVLVFVLAALFWVYEFVFLMDLQDGVFNGRNDKTLWCVAFMACPVLAPFAFLLWTRVKKIEKHP